MKKLKIFSLILVSSASAFILADSYPLMFIKNTIKKNNAPIIEEKEEKIFTPDSSVKFALDDISKLSDEEQKETRYLSLYNISSNERINVFNSISFLCNSLSINRKIFVPVFVENSEETLIRINIKNYGWNFKTWDDLAKKGSGTRPQPEPFFNSFIPVMAQVAQPPEIKIPEKEIKDGKDSKEGKEKVSKEIKPKIPDEVYKKFIPNDLEASYPSWIEKTNYSSLKKLTKSSTPILRADWFLVNASLPPFYYEFLQVGKTEKEFTELIFADDALAKKAKSRDKSIISISNVARNNRVILRTPTFTGGYYWFTHDSKSSVHDKNRLNNVLNEDFDAMNSIGSLPNGLQIYFASDSKGNRLDVIDHEIGSDNLAIDKTIRPGRSCIICHTEGIKTLDDDVRALKVPLFAATTREQNFELENLYGSDLISQIEKDQNYYSIAVKKANSLSPSENSNLFSNIYDKYAETPLTKETIALDCGISVSELDRFIGLSSDPVIFNLNKTPIRPIRRDQWERSYQNFMNLINKK